MGCCVTRVPPAQQKPGLCIPPETCRAFVANVYDGDTFTVHVDMGPRLGTCRFRCRLQHVDTPELNGPAAPDAQRARAFVMDAIGKKTVKLHVARKMDKYGRLLVTVPLPGHSSGDLGSALIAAGLAVPYEGGKKATAQ